MMGWDLEWQIKKNNANEMLRKSTDPPKKNDNQLLKSTYDMSLPLC
jgi:hypothetical protein